MKTAAIILSHYKQRESNISYIVSDLLNGSNIPDKIIIICDNPEINLNLPSTVSVIRSDDTLPVHIRYAIGLTLNYDYYLLIDDDLTVNKDTLKQFITYAKKYPYSILGFEGSKIDRNNDTPYTSGIQVQDGEADIIIRCWFVPRFNLNYALQLRSMNLDLPEHNVDDILLCLGHQLIADGKNIVIPHPENTHLIDLPDGQVGQCLSPNHYINRNKCIRTLFDHFK